jgi:hypothetical protein
MTKTRTIITLGIALGCAALVLFGTAADHPPRTIPLHGPFGVTVQLIPTDTPGVFNSPIEGVGNVGTLGPCTVAIEQTVDFRNNPPTLEAQWVLTFADGDELNVRTHGTGTPILSNPAFLNLAGGGAISGGTGRLANATGELRFTGVAHVDTPPNVSPAESHGTFTVEGFVRLSNQ